MNGKTDSNATFEWWHMVDNCVYETADGIFGNEIYVSRFGL